jgi:hypothetical protein
VQRINNKELIIFVVTTAIVLTSLVSTFGGKSSAQSLPLTGLNSIGQCGSSTNQFNVLLTKVPASAQLYIKLNSTQESSSNVAVYFQSFSDSQCHLIGIDSPSYSSWSKVGPYNLDTSDGGAFVIVGSGLGALPYQAVASLLVLPNPLVCTPVINCKISYHGYQGVLSPQIISGATESVAVYVASPLNSVGYSKATYYSNNQFLYSSKQLQPINRNYLNGGVQHVSIQINLTNQQVVTITQTINMGTDYTGTLYIKSLVYRSQNKVWVFVILALILVVLLLLLWIVRLIYKHRRYQVHYGLNHLSESHEQISKVDPPDNYVITD